MSLREKQNLLGAFCSEYFRKSKKNLLIAALIGETVSYMYSASQREMTADPT